MKILPSQIPYSRPSEPISRAAEAPKLAGSTEREPQQVEDRFSPTEPSPSTESPKRLGKHRWTAMGALTGLAVGSAVGASLTSGSLGAAIAWGAGLGAAAGKVADLYSVPETLYHFTSEESAASITESGRLDPRPGNHGVGVYTTRYLSRSVAALQRATSTDMVFSIDSRSHDVKRTVIPGTFVLTEPVSVQTPEVKLNEAPDSKLADWLHRFDWREKVDLFGSRKEEAGVRPPDLDESSERE